VWYDEPPSIRSPARSIISYRRSTWCCVEQSRPSGAHRLGEYDWIMSRDDQVLIVDSVNANAPGKARLLTVPRMDHSFSTHSTPKAAYDRMAPGLPQSAPPRSLRSFARQCRLADLLRRGGLCGVPRRTADEQLALVIGAELQVHHFFALGLAAKLR